MNEWVGEWVGGWWMGGWMGGWVDGSMDEEVNYLRILLGGKDLTSILAPFSSWICVASPARLYPPSEAVNHRLWKSPCHSIPTIVRWLKTQVHVGYAPQLILLQHNPYTNARNNLEEGKGPEVGWKIMSKKPHPWNLINVSTWRRPEQWYPSWHNTDGRNLMQPRRWRVTDNNGCWEEKN